VAGFEIFLDDLPPVKTKAGWTRPLLRPSPFQPVTRDFAFVVAADVPAETLVRAARGADKALISEVQVFDVYAGKGIPEGQTSLAIQVTLRPVDRTLTDAEIEAVSGRIVAAVEKRTGGALRG